MGNIVTPDQGLLPLPAYSDAITPYPWWLTTALAIWALLALLCCWLLCLLYLLRYCCKWWRHRQYAVDRKTLREKFFGAGRVNGRQGVYAMNEQHFATAPLPPVPPYAVGGGNFYGVLRPYVTAAPRNAAFESGSEYFSEEDNGLRPMTMIAKQPTENIETNVHRNITKNYYINEEKNYFIQSDPSLQSPAHDPIVQTLPAPTVTTVNMAAERITDNPNWENININPNADFENQKPKQASAEIVTADPSLSKQPVKYENPPNIFTHEPETPKANRRMLGAHASVSSDDGSTTSEMSGHDSESIYETIRVVTPKKHPLPPLEDEDEDDDDYKTAGIDEVEFEVKDLIRLQKANARNGDPYDDILSSTNLPRQDLTPQASSISSSSTLHNLMPTNSQPDPIHGGSGAEETVTETVKTQQIQTTVRQIGQPLGDSAFFVPLSSAITHHNEQPNDERKIIVPLSTSIDHEEQPAIQHF